jgi:hypothetical protein
MPHEKNQTRSGKEARYYRPDGKGWLDRTEKQESESETNPC